MIYISHNNKVIKNADKVYNIIKDENNITQLKKANWDSQKKSMDISLKWNMFNIWTIKLILNGSKKYN